jgi:hypothetical protein
VLRNDKATLQGPAKTVAAANYRGRGWASASRLIEPNPTNKTEETTVKTAAVARILLGLAVLALIGVTAQAEDNKNITINGGRNTVFMGTHSHQTAVKPCTKGKFYDNICGGTINIDDGWTVSDGSPINEEYTPAGQIKVLKAGTTTKVGVTVSYVEGTNGATVILDKSCKNLPCGTFGKTNICKGKISHLYDAGDQYVVETFKCKAKLKKGELVWAYPMADENSWLAWDLSGASGGFVEGENGVWGTYESGEPVGGLAIY